MTTPSESTWPAPRQPGETAEQAEARRALVMDVTARMRGGDEDVPTKYPIADAVLAQLESAFTYHAPKEGQPQRYVLLRDNARLYAMLICQLVPPGRERALALTNLEQAVFWANAGIARGE